MQENGLKSLIENSKRAARKVVKRLKNEFGTEINKTEVISDSNFVIIDIEVIKNDGEHFFIYFKGYAVEQFNEEAVFDLIKRRITNYTGDDLD